MESELVQTCMLSKEQLRDSNCCRFCGIGGNVNDPFFAISFIPIYEQSDMVETLREKLDVLINRYLPIKVYENELFYPRLICSTCFYAFEETIAFFDKISEGQKLLRKIIDKQREPLPVMEKLNFSSKNPIVQATPKKRGRPRRDPNQPKEKPVFIIKDDHEKPKRNIRAPERYGKDYTEVSIKLEEKEAAVLPSQELQPDPFFDSIQEPEVMELPVDKSISRNSSQNSLSTRLSDSALIGSLDTHSEFTSVTSGPNSILDLTRLNVIMYGDDEDLEETILTQSVPKSNPTEVPVSLDVIHVPDNASDVIILPTTRFHEYQDISIEDDGNDSDFQVKQRTVKIKRGRGRPRKKRKSRKVFKCPTCEKHFGHASSLRYHRKSVHETATAKKYDCNQCQKVFMHKTLLKSHMQAHSERRDFNCIDCSKKFKSRTSLNTHIKTIHQGVRFKCEQCEAPFSFKSSLKAHLRLHNGEKPYVCIYCQKGFAQRSNMEEHLRIHTNSRPFRCLSLSCEKTFKTASQFRNHKLTHLDQKLFLCSICGKSFSTHDHFKRHIRRHGEKAECDICHKNFADPSNFTKHMKNHQPASLNTSKSRQNPLDKSKTRHAVEEDEHQLDFFVRPGKPSAESRAKRFFKNSEPLTQDQIQIRDVFSQGILTGDLPSLGGDLTDDSGSLVQILNAEGLLESSSQDGQVIYVYPDDLPIFTITLNDNQQAIEVRANDETTLQALGNLAGGPITFATVEGSELSTQYFNLETVDGTTLSVPSVRTGLDMGASNEMSLGALIIPNQGTDQSQEIQGHVEGNSSLTSTEQNSSTDISQ